MKRLCFRKIRLWPRFCRNNKKNINGALTLLSVFLFVIFSTLALGMLYLTQVYLKTSGYRKNIMLLEYASENGIKQGYGYLQNRLSLVSSPIVLTETEASQLLNDSQAQGDAIVQRALGCDLPLDLGDKWERLAWESLMDFQFSGLREEQEYFLVEYKGRISAEGKLQGFKQTSSSSLASILDILAGHIPLPSIPLLVDKPMTSEERRSFLVENKIEMIPSGHADQLPVAAAFSEGGLLPQQAGQLLAKALKIEIFHPQDLSPAKLRLALGLEVNNEPVPDGVYLIQDDLGLGGVFVQGDLDEMVLAIQENFQIIAFHQGQKLWILKFSPEDGKTIFINPTGVQSFEYVPRGIIIVNGKILSLGGGYEDTEGKILMATQDEIPCVLRGVNLSIISSDEITLSSHLIYQGVMWKEGVPYLKDSNSQLVIHAVGQDFLDGEEKAGQIVIGENSPEKMKVQASLSASGKGIAVLGENRQVQLFGSLQTSELALNKNEISIKYDDRFFRQSESIFKNVLFTEKPVLYISCFKITEWRENL